MVVDAASDVGARTGGLRLGVLELGGPAQAMSLAPMLAELGYQRYWMSEHYSPTQSPAPLVLAAALAALPGTGSLRLGTAGVLVTLRSPESIVADASIPMALRPGGFDLGLAGAATGHPDVDEALLDGRPRCVMGAYEQRLGELCGLVDERSHALPVPANRSRPRIDWDPAMSLRPSCGSAAPVQGRRRWQDGWGCRMRSTTDSRHPTPWLRRSSTRTGPVSGHASAARRDTPSSRTFIDIGRADSAGPREERAGEAAETVVALAARCAVEEVVVAELDPRIERQRQAYRALAAGIGTPLSDPAL